MNNRVLITGIGGPAGRSALAFFREKGSEIAGTDMREVEESPDRFHKVPAALDPSYPARLLEVIGSEEPSLLVPTVTEELVLVAGLADRIRKAGAMVFISPEKGAHIAASKLRTAEALASMGVAVPRTLDGNEPRERAADEVGFPMLAKPDFSRGGRGVVVINTPEELAAETREGIIFQEFIPGEEYDGNLFIEDGRAAAAVVLRKTLLKEGIVGNAAGVERVEHPEVLDLCVTSALKLDLTGPLDIDVRLREDGTPVVLEINARLGGNVLSAPEVLESLYSAWIIKEEN